MTFEEFKARFRLSLSDQQEAAVQAVDGYVLLLAVPGSGKTTVLVTRLGYMVYCRRIPPEQILTMTYTVAATRDMRNRFASIFGPEFAQRLEFRTINGVCAKIIRLYEQSRGTTAFRLLSDDAEGSQSVILNGIYRNILNSFPTEGDIRELQTKISYVKNMMLSQDEICEIDADIPYFSHIYQAYGAFLREKKLMDYDDQMVYARTILRRCPDLLQQLHRRCPYLCVDEAQDTSRIQHSVIEMLSAGSGNLFMVGDEDQSIYGFRAAYPEALLSFEQRHPGAAVLLMEQNFRSTGSIVKVADAFIRTSTSRRDKRMITKRIDGSQVEELRVFGRIGQYDVLTEAAKCCAAQAPSDHPATTAALFRDNECMVPLVDLLERQGIPYRIRGGDLLFFTHRTVNDIRDIVAFAQNMTDRERFRNIYYKLDLHLKKEEVEWALRTCPTGGNLLDWIIRSDQINPWVKGRCKSLRTHMTHLLQERADRAMARILLYMGYHDYLENREISDAKIEILCILARQEPSILRLMERLEELNAIIRQGSTVEDASFVLSTIHSSKGLEYDTVYIADIYDGLLPAAESSDRRLYEEEIRLFYVAMTRAKNRLVLFSIEGTKSIFLKQVFQPVKKKKISRPVLPPSSVDENGQAELDREVARFTQGVRIVHRSYGSGVIASVASSAPKSRIAGPADPIAEIVFQDGTTKRILLSAALRSHLLEIVDSRTDSVTPSTE